MVVLTKFLTKLREIKVRPYIKGKVLDIGCGDANVIKNKAVTIYFGVDLEDKVINLTKKYPYGKFLSKNLEYDEINLPEKVDLVLMTAFIEHITNFENPIIQSIKNLKNKGKIVLTTPTEFGNLIHLIISKFRLLPKEVKDAHKIVLSKKDFLKLAEKFNLQIIKYKKFELFCNQLVIFEI